MKKLFAKILVTALILATIPFASVRAAHINLLVVGGGGGAGNTWGGGGGAGGYIASSSYIVTPQSYSITIGSAGSKGDPGTNGGDTIFASTTAIGGGRGGYLGVAATNGGSGGGGSGELSAAGSGTAGQGNNGGTSSSYHVNGGGGGGCGSAGVANAGGSGCTNTISGSSVEYSRGGNPFSIAVGASEYGNGGDRESANNAGQGIVIISYATDGSDGVSTASTGGTITTSGNQTIHTFTTSGTFTMQAPQVSLRKIRGIGISR